MSTYYDLEDLEGPVLRPPPARRAAVVASCFALGCVLGWLLSTCLHNPQTQIAMARVIPTQVVQAVGATVAAATLANPTAAADLRTLFGTPPARPEYNIIGDARETDLPRGKSTSDTQEAKTRLSQATKRLSKVAFDIRGGHFSAGRFELRRYFDTLRFDINTMAAASPPDVQEQIGAAKKDLFDSVEELDLAMFTKDRTSAVRLHQEVVGKVDAIARYL